MTARLDSYAQRLADLKTKPQGSVADLARALAATKGQSEPLLFALAVALRAELEDIAKYRYARPEDILHALLFAVVRLNGNPRPLAREDAEVAEELVGRVQSRLYTDRRSDAREQAGRAKLAQARPSRERGIDAADRLDLKQRLDRLKPADRALLVEASAYGCDHNQLAEQLGVTPIAARKQLSRVKEKARQTPPRTPKK